MTTSDINLLQTKTTTSLLGKNVENLIQIVSLLLLSVVVVVGILAGATYFLLQSQRSQLAETKNQLLTAIQTDQAKESMLVAINSRLSTIEKIIEGQRSYAPYIDTTLKILTSYAFTLSSFAIGKDNTVSITVDMSSVEDAIDMLSMIMTMEKEHTIRNPVLNSFSLGDGGKISVAVSYTVVL